MTSAIRTGGRWSAKCTRTCWKAPSIRKSRTTAPRFRWTIRKNGKESVKLLGKLTLHGVTRSQPIHARLAINGDMLHAFGEFTIRQSDYNIKPVSAIGGGLKVKDELKFSFDIVGRKQE